MTLLQRVILNSAEFASVNFTCYAEGGYFAFSLYLNVFECTFSGT